MTEENTTVDSTQEQESDKVRKVRSSFTMDAGVMDLLKAKAKADNTPVSTVIENAVAKFLGV